MIFLTSLCFLYSCNDSSDNEDDIEEEVTSARIIEILGQNKKWVRVSLVSEEEKTLNGITSTDWYELIPECYQDNEINFNAFLFSSGNYDLYEDFADMYMGEELCESNESITRDNIFNWTLDGEKKMISIEFSEYDHEYLYGEIGNEISNVENWYIRSITESEIIFEYVKEWNGDTYNMEAKYILTE
ncbi:hypothetical protein [Chondrinema litorale]|uniref:hypothetical protein n=1 Tax=Chondrinema litorale TaxID=2994555 RepID=UPI0025433842|nr:hypothetical protein [Chondrinema litorale]UZS00071.1 hypothetical protein OQ292_39720 [Chondrinema litorale]